MMRSLKHLQSNNGFTYIEVLLTLLLTSLISLMVLTNLNPIKASIFKGKKRVHYNYQLLNLRLILNNEAQNLQTPWFLREHLIEIEDTNIKIFYYLGDSKKFLELISDESGVQININDETIFNSDLLYGEFSIKGSLIIYTDGDIKFSIPMGVFIA